MPSIFVAIAIGFRIRRHIPGGSHNVGAGLQQFHQPAGDVCAQFYSVLQNTAQLRNDIPSQHQGQDDPRPLDADGDVLGNQHHDSVDNAAINTTAIIYIDLQVVHLVY